MTRRPVRELESLRTGKGVTPEAFEGDLLEAQVDCRVTHDAIIEWKFRGIDVIWNGVKGTLAVMSHEAAWPIQDNRLAFSLFLDRRGLEIFSADGLRLMPVPNALPKPRDRRITCHIRSGIVSDATRVWNLRPLRAFNSQMPAHASAFTRAQTPASHRLGVLPLSHGGVIWYNRQKQWGCKSESSGISVVGGGRGWLSRRRLVREGPDGWPRRDEDQRQGEG